MEEEIIKIIENFLRDIAKQFPANISQREKAILAFRQSGKTLQHIGNSMKLTRERVRQIERGAKGKIDISHTMAVELYKRTIPYYIKEEELEYIFIKWYLQETGKEFLEGKKKWQEFITKLWENKQNDLHNSDNNNN
jgi:transcriptional regulator